MNLPEDCRLAYIVDHESSYAIDHRPRKSVTVCAATEGGSAAWEFIVEQYDNLDGKPALQLRMFDDSWDAFAQVPELFEALRTETPNTLDALRVILDRIGATDTTSRNAPTRVGRD